MAVKKNESTEIIVHHVERGEVRYCILGTTPLIPRAMSGKVKQELLMPARKKNRAEKEQTFKHDPMAEFLESAMILRDDSEPTLIAMPCGAFKRAMATVTKDVAGSSAAQIGRLTFVTDYNVNVYGIPEMLMSVVRNAGIVRTPDIRTRVILRHWCCELTIRYARPMLNERTVTTLLANAGLYIGVGDWRQEKGSGSMGLFEIVPENDDAFVAVKKHGRAAQQAAMKDPAPFDEETESLFSWWKEEAASRRDTPAVEPKAAAKKKKGA